MVSAAAVHPFLRDTEGLISVLPFGGVAEGEDVILEKMPAVSKDELGTVPVAFGLAHLQMSVADVASSDELALALTFALLHCT
jgi:hypothetical protein